MTKKFTKLFLIASCLWLHFGAFAHGETFINSTGAGPGTVTDVANDTAAMEIGGNEDVRISPNPPLPSGVEEDVAVTAVLVNLFSKLHQVNMMEIEMGKLAMEKGQSEQVRAYGQRLMRDHQAHDRKLMAFAESKNIPVDRSRGLSPAERVKHQGVSARLYGAIPEQFDVLFLRAMKEAHASTVAEVESVISQLPNVAERKFLVKIRPILSQHEKLSTLLLEKNAG